MVGLWFAALWDGRWVFGTASGETDIRSVVCLWFGHIMCSIFPIGPGCAIEHLSQWQLAPCLVTTETEGTGLTAGEREVRQGEWSRLKTGNRCLTGGSTCLSHQGANVGLVISSCILAGALGSVRGPGTPAYEITPWNPDQIPGIFYFYEHNDKRMPGMFGVGTGGSWEEPYLLFWERLSDHSWNSILRPDWIRSDVG